MRLSELARELGVETKTIINYLWSEGIRGYKAANKIEGYHEELVRNHFRGKDSSESLSRIWFHDPVRPKAILRRGGNRERSFIPFDERPWEQPEEAKQPQKPAEELEPEVKPKAILRRGGNRERSFIPPDKRPAEQPKELECPECKTEFQGSGIVQCPTCGMTFCSECMEQLPADVQECPYCGNTKEQPESEPTQVIESVQELNNFLRHLFEALKQPKPKPTKEPNRTSKDKDNTVPQSTQKQPEDKQDTPDVPKLSSALIKISDLAKEIGVDPKLICAYLHKRGYGDYSPESMISDFIANEVRNDFPKKPEVKPTKTSVRERLKKWFGIGKK